MDYETKLYLDNLIEAINRPDWWSVILSTISTVAVIVIAVVQIRIQIIQNRLVRYNEIIELYNNIKKIHWYVKYIFRDINYALENLKYHKTYFDQGITTFKELRRWFMENESNLRFSAKMTDEEYYGYLNFLCKLENVSSKMNEYINQKDVINTESKANSNEWILDDNARINTILTHIVTDERTAIKNLLLDIKTFKENVLSHSILKRLEKLCTL